MATSSDDMKLTFRRYEDGDDQHRPWSEEIWQSSWTHKCPTYVHRTPPCQGSCPSGHDIRGWLDIVRGIEKPAGGKSWQEYAFERMTLSNPFPAIMGRVCPAPCEDGCNRNQVEDHVGINSVEHFVGNWALENGMKFQAGAETGKKIAVVGGGPGGLAAAYQLRLKGHAVTLFDEHAELGGMMRYGIPGYRTPRHVLDGEINRIVDMGVEVKTKTRVGRDVAMADLEKDYDAIVWAIGAQAGRGLPVANWDAAVNCVSGVAFLEAFNDGRLQHVGGKVLVIGGGDTSIDVASVARRLGKITEVHEKDMPENVILGHTAHDVASTAKREGADVELISRQPVEKMNAAQHEIDDATREGVKITGSLTPVEVVLDANGRAKGLKVAKLEYASGKAVQVEGSEFVIEADLIVAAIGQMGDFTGLDGLDNGKGLINADKTFRVPGKEKHFVCGDAVRPHLLTTAIGQASIASEAIDQYLAGKEPGKRPKVDVHHFSLLAKLNETGLAPQEFHGLTKEEVIKAEGFAKEIDLGVRGTSDAGFAVHNYEDRSAHEIISADELFLGHFGYTPRLKRSTVEVSSEEVLGHFEERLQALDEQQVVAEAKRCMSCGMCFECDNCVVYCPQDAVHKTKRDQTTTGRYVYTDYNRCIGCHICADVCPTGYIQMGMGD